MYETLSIRATNTPENNPYATSSDCQGHVSRQVILSWFMM